MAAHAESNADMLLDELQWAVKPQRFQPFLSKQVDLNLSLWMYFIRNRFKRVVLQFRLLEAFAALPSFIAKVVERGEVPTSAAVLQQAQLGAYFVEFRAEATPLLHSSSAVEPSNTC
jgi:hypothetical protein